MYQISVRIKGTTPLLQHSFTKATLSTLMEGANKKTGAVDYSLEWMKTMYTKDGMLVQPSSHIEGALVKAATSFKIKGKSNKTWRDAFRAYCYATPDMIPHIWEGHYVEAPDASLLETPTENLSVSIMRVVVQRSAVARSRLQIAAGWELDFCLEIQDDQLRPDVVSEVLAESGRAVGIGDFRPKYGRFSVINFQVEQ